MSSVDFDTVESCFDSVNGCLSVVINNGRDLRGGETSGTGEVSGFATGQKYFPSSGYGIVGGRDGCGISTRLINCWKMD